MLDWLLQNNQLAALIAFVIVLVPVVIIHELGHFIAGRSVGVTILEFGIGFPPRIGKLFTVWGTEFTLNWLPFGGFVRPLGEDIVSQKDSEYENMDRREAEERGLENIKSVGEAKPLQRIWFLSAGAIFNLITAFFVFIVLGLVGIPGERLQVIHIESGSALANAGLQNNDVIASVNGENFLIAENFFEIASQTNTPPQLTILRGEQGQEITATLSDTPAFSPQVDDFFVYIVGVADNAPADRAGMQPGDLVRRFNDEPVRSVVHLVELTNQHLGETITLGIQRGDETLTIDITPRQNPPEGEGSMGIMIDTAFHNTEAGLSYRPLPDQTIVPLSLSESIQYSAARFQGIINAIVSIPAQLSSGQITAAEARPVSIVGISQVGGFFLQESIAQDRPIELLNYVAIISIALGLTNLLPLPALDGGRILFVIIEMVRGKPIPPEREGFVHLLGLAFLLSLTVVFVINDIINPVTDLIR